jgi:hypothetical protein
MTAGVWFGLRPWANPLRFGERFKPPDSVVIDIGCMKLREPRRKVMIKARMRAAAGWADACILNLSKSGMLVRAQQAPSRGSYLEIRRGSHVIVARVVWASEDKFGVVAQEPIPADELVRDPDGATAKPANGNFVERRTSARPPERRHEQSRFRGRILEFATFATFGALMATFLFGEVGEVLARPMTAVRTALSD